MRCCLLFLLMLSVVARPLRAESAPAMPVPGIPLQVTGISSAMEAPARAVLEKQWALSGHKAMSAPLADDLAFFLQQHYRYSGYAEAVVDWNLPGTSAELQVREGLRRTVGVVHFKGVDEKNASALRPYLTRQTQEREGRMTKVLPFVEGDLEAGLGLVVRKLQSDGYLAATAEPLVLATPDSRGSIDITLTLHPGPLSVFGDITILGDSDALSNKARENIMALRGQPFSEVRLENVRKEAKGDLQTQGRFAAEVTAFAAVSNAAGSSIPATLTVQAGGVFRVAPVKVDQSLRTGAARVAEAVFQSATGQVYAPETLDLLHRRSMDTGIFARLEVEPSVLESGLVELLISGEETKSKTLGFFGGYETFYGPIAGIEARHVNFLDSGNALGLRAELRGTGANGSLQWTDPAILSSRNALGISLGLETFAFKDYSRNTLFLRNSLTRRLNRHITAEAFSTILLSEVDTTVLTPEELGPDSYETLTVGGRLTLDYRDNPLSPKSGWLAGAALEGGLDRGGERNIGFGRTDLNASWYSPLGGSWRLALGARASAIRSSGGVGDLPIDLRLFNGGGTTVRSFADREMGATSASGSTPLGGTALAVVNAEVSYEFMTNFEMAAFVDAGSLSQEEGELFSLDGVRYGVGLGLRYQLPIGPLRVDYGYNPNRHPGEAAGALHVTFGFAF